MTYILIQLLLIFFCFVIEEEEKRNTVYKIMFVFLTILLIFRYGQGTDYFNYNVIFNNLSSYKNIFVSGDPGFNILILLSKSIGINFIVFNALIAIISMLLVYRFLNKFSKNKILALTAFYPMYYIVFWFSAIRQGLAMSIFIGILLPLLYKKRYFLYAVGTIFTASFHLSAMFLLVLLIVNFIPLYNKKIFSVTIIAMIIYHIFGVQNYIISMLPSNFQYRISTYLSDGISYGALANRLLLFLIVIYLFYNSNNEQKDENLFLFNIYIFGFFLYLMLMTSPAIASRLNFYIKVLDCVLISNMISSSFSNRINTIKLIILNTILLVLLIKNISSLLYQGDYYSHVSVIKYPYISIFNKDKIHSYRQISEDIRYKSLFPSKYQWPIEIDK